MGAELVSDEGRPNVQGLHPVSKETKTRASRNVLAARAVIVPLHKAQLVADGRRVQSPLWYPDIWLEGRPRRGWRMMRRREDIVTKLRGVRPQEGEGAHGVQALNPLNPGFHAKWGHSGPRRMQCKAVQCSAAQRNLQIAVY